MILDRREQETTFTTDVWNKKSEKGNSTNEMSAHTAANARLHTITHFTTNLPQLQRKYIQEYVRLFYIAMFTEKGTRTISLIAPTSLAICAHTHTGHQYLYVDLRTHDNNDGTVTIYHNLLRFQGILSISRLGFDTFFFCSLVHLKNCVSLPLA